MTSVNTETPQLRAACYCRISSDPHDKREGVDRQRQDTADVCAIQDWIPSGFYIDNDRSASNGKQRQEWDRLLCDIKAEKVDAIVVWNQDRGWRKMSDLESLRPLLEPRGVLLATTNIGVIDFRNADDVFRAQVSTAMSEMEVAKMKVRMKRAARDRAERGVPKWTKAFGYRTVNGKLELDPRTAPLVQEAYAAILAGSTLNDVARLFNDAGAHGLNGKPWVASTVSLFMRAPRNAGLRAHNDEIVGQGTWPAIVEQATWKSAQTVMNDPRRKPGRKSVKRHLLTGVLMCGKCGHHLAGGSQTKQRTRVYSCKGCRGVSIRAEQIEPLLYTIVAGRLAMPDAVDLLKSAVHDTAAAEAIRLELESLYGELQKIGIERGKRLLTGEQAQIATAYINGDIAELERRQQDDERLRIFADLPLGTPQIADAIKALSPGRFRAVVDVLVSVTVAPVGKGGYLVDPETHKKHIDPERVHVDWR